MKYLIISDLHANWEALSAVLDAAAGQFGEILCCGDVVGYGADPNMVTEWARAHAAIVIRGNHDRACASLTGIEWFNPLAQSATRWTNQKLTAENRAWLLQLPKGPALLDGFQVVHGSPVDEDEYVLSVTEATEAFHVSDSALTFFGHTHVQSGFEYRRMKTRRWNAGELKTPIHIEDTSGYLVNPGSVGQPRDSDPRAAYALYDSESRLLQLCRAEYDVSAAQRKIVQAQLPMLLAQRLAFGN